MVDLAGDINAKQGFLPNLEGIDVLPRGVYTLDSEKVIVWADQVIATAEPGYALVGAFDSFGRFCTRAHDGTTAAAHTSGTTLTPTGDPVPDSPTAALTATAEAAPDATADVGTFLLTYPADEWRRATDHLVRIWVKVGPLDTDWARRPTPAEAEDMTDEYVTVTLGA